MPGRDRVRVQIDSGATEAVGPKEIAKAFAKKETDMSNSVAGYIAASGSSIENYGEKNIMGYADDGESVSVRVRHKMSLG